MKKKAGTLSAANQQVDSLVHRMQNVTTFELLVFIDSGGRWNYSTKEEFVQMQHN